MLLTKQAVVLDMSGRKDNFVHKHQKGIGLEKLNPLLTQKKKWIYTWHIQKHHFSGKRRQN
jgi:hypothetical protein